MTITRRHALALGGGALALGGLSGLPAFASLADDAVMKITGGVAATEGGVELTAPEIAENGNTVPVAVSAPGATMIAILAPSNPAPEVATFNFGPLSGAAEAATRIRLAKTQKVIAIAKMADGTFHMASATVKVTIGGCGG